MAESSASIATTCPMKSDRPLPRSEPFPAESAAEVLPPPRHFARRSFLRSLGIASAVLLPSAAGLAHGHDEDDDDSRHATNGGRLTHGDAAILRFLAAAELIETDLWQQYTELTLGNDAYGKAIEAIDDDMPQYISDNTDDELSHATFLNAYLVSKGVEAVNLDAFRTLPSSPAAGATQKGRLTSLASLNVDTSWYLRYRGTGNPDLGATFGQAVNITGRPAIPLAGPYTDTQMQAIANTAAFHFGTIEQGGSSLYGSLLSKVTSLEVVRILAGIGGSEVHHFAIWHDQIGNVPPLDNGDGLVFPDLNANPATATSLIMPEPCHFLRNNLPLCSIIRPLAGRNAGAMAAVTALTNSRLFTGQSVRFFRQLNALARSADAAFRQLG
jgi:hypothetical protein